jgi:hypothetical protein
MHYCKREQSLCAFWKLQDAEQEETNWSGNLDKYDWLEYYVCYGQLTHSFLMLARAYQCNFGCMLPSVVD